MRVSWRWFRKRLFGIAPEEATFARRGFRAGDLGSCRRLEQIGTTFLQGYHVALEEDDPKAVACRLNTTPAELSGFAFEGAAMALGLLDVLTPWRRSRWLTLLSGPGAAHVYMVHVGLGWVLARLHRRVEPTLAQLDPLLGWLAVDGYGFHEGYFHWRRSVQAHMVPDRLTGYARRVFDHGLGRSLWFVEGADVTSLPRTLATFPVRRQPDLWSGVGLACAYAGSIEETALNALKESAGPYQPQLAQGAAFAAKARQRAGNPAAHTDKACAVLCGLSAAAAAALTDAALEHLPSAGPEPAYEVWRCRIQAHFTQRRS